MIGKLRILFWIGVILLVLPHLGIPDTGKTIFTIALGLVVITLSIKLRHAYKKLKFQLRHVDQPKVEENVIHG